jgi:seryl-tRNA synthetase
VIDINLIREQPDLVRKALADRQMDTAPVEQILALDVKRREIIQTVRAYQGFC